MSNIINKLNIVSPGYKREVGDNLTRRGQKFSDIKHHYSLDEMMLIDSAPEILEALICILADNRIKIPAEKIKKAVLSVEKATGKSWELIK